ncbi:MAG: AsmA-like C-terminal region-containing protein [Bacteroidia bacterium]|nr:AsmA family protein [Bacteroidia bacterium]MDW8016064.1 AsmA-like C-terminal region-containing protein [Bacteroidia bacterium]
MRKALYIIGGLVLVFLLLGGILPFFFRDKIDASLKAQINRSVNAHVDYQRLGLSLFRHFPALTLRLENLLVINKEPFAGDTLLHCKAIDVGVDVLKAIRGEIEITRLYLIEPRIFVQVRQDGKASWDITLPDTARAAATETPAETTATAFKIGLRRYEIQNAYITYRDSSLEVYTRLIDLTHTGKGDLTQDELLFRTETQIAQLFFTYGDISYFSGQSLKAGIDLDMNFPANRYSLRRGDIQINALPLSLSGTVSLPDTIRTLLDLRFAAPSASLKELLSLIPAAYKRGYESLSTEGTLRLEGYVQGELRDTLLPSFGLTLSIEKGRIQYKDLPQPIQQLELRLKVENAASTLESLQVKVDTFLMQAGNTTLQAKAQTLGLSQMKIQAHTQGKGTLSDFASALPLGYEARGRFEIDAKVEGIYAEKKLPSVEGKFLLKEGYIKLAEFPTPVEALEIDFVAESPEGLPSRTVATLRRLYAVVAGEAIEASLTLQNLEALNYAVSLRGGADLGAWTRIFPIESTEVAGKVQIDLTTQGSREALEKHDYTRLPTRGTLTLQNLSYRSPQLPQGLTIAQATLTFTPQYLLLKGYKGTLGRSDIALDGRLENYLGYILRDEKVSGNLNLLSSRLDLNEWISSDTTSASTPSEADTTAASEVVVVPANIDFIFQAQIGEMLYEKMIFRNARGRIIVRDQAVRLEGFEMEGFGGKFALSGSYIAPTKSSARWDMEFRLQNVQIEEVTPHFQTMQRLAPIVKSTQGRVNLLLNAGSALQPDFLPVLSTLSGKGQAEVLQAVVQGSASLKALSDAAKMPQLNTLRLNNTIIRFKIQNGELQVEPFTVRAGELSMDVKGVTRLDQTIAYDIGIEVPGGWAQSFLQAATLPLQAPSTIRLIAELGGTLAQPKVLRIRPAGGTATAGEAVSARLEEEKAKLEAEARRRKDSLEAALRAKEDSLRRALEEKKRAEEERLRREAEERRRQEEERLRREAEERRRQEEERLRRQAEEEKKKKEEELKKKLPFPR